MGNEVVGLDPASGDLRWSHPHATKWGLNICTPVFGDDGLLLLASAYDVGSRCLQLTKDGDRTRVRELWADRRRLRVHHGNVLRLGDFVFGSSGDFGPAFLQAVNVKTGELAWQKRGFAKATLVQCGEKSILLDEDGKLALLTLAPTGVTMHAQAEVLNGLSRTPPALVGSRLFLRNHKVIMALELGDPRQKEP